MYVLLSGPCTIATSAPRLCMMPRTEISATVMPATPSPRFACGPPRLGARAEQAEERIAPAVGLVGVRIGRRRRRRWRLRHGSRGRLTGWRGRRGRRLRRRRGLHQHEKQQGGVHG